MNRRSFMSRASVLIASAVAGLGCALKCRREPQEPQEIKLKIKPLPSRPDDTGIYVDVQRGIGNHWKYDAASCDGVLVPQTFAADTRDGWLRYWLPRSEWTYDDNGPLIEGAKNGKILLREVESGLWVG